MKNIFRKLIALVLCFVLIAPVSVMAADEISEKVSFTVSGSASGDSPACVKVGETVTVKASDAVSGLDLTNIINFTYKYSIDGAVVEGETGSTITVPTGSDGKKLKIEITSANSDLTGTAVLEISIAPAAPTVKSITREGAVGTSYTVTLNTAQAPEGAAVKYGYRLANQEMYWNDTGVFTGIADGTTVFFRVKYQESGAAECVSNETILTIRDIEEAIDILTISDSSGTEVLTHAPLNAVMRAVCINSLSNLQYEWSVNGTVLSTAETLNLGGDTQYIGKTLTLRVYSRTLGGDMSVSIPIVGEQSKPEAPEISEMSFNKTVLKAVTSPNGTSVEYGVKKDGSTVEWQSSNEFTGLPLNTTVSFYVRFLGNDQYSASPESDPLTVKVVCQKMTNCPGLAFKDVSASSWFHHAVDYVKSMDYMSGKSPTTFVPNANLTRAEIVQVLYNMEGCPTPTIDNPFTDVKEGAWYYNAVLWAKEVGISDGTSAAKFSPNQYATREQVVYMLRDYIELKGGDVNAAADISGYSDANKVSSWALEAVQWAIAEGVISGTTPTTISPRGNTTRAHFAQMIYNYFGN